MRWAGVRRWFGDGLLGAYRATFVTGVLSFMVLGAMGYPQWGACTAGVFLCCSGVLVVGLGLFFLWGGVSGLLATYRSDQRILTRGEVSKSVLGGRGLAVTDEFAVWGGILSSSYAPPTLSLMKLLIPGGEIQQAVVVLGRQDRDPLGLGGLGQPKVHTEAHRNLLLEIALQLIARRR